MLSIITGMWLPLGAAQASVIRQIITASTPAVLLFALLRASAAAPGNYSTTASVDDVAINHPLIPMFSSAKIPGTNPVNLRAAITYPVVVQTVGADDKTGNELNSFIFNFCASILSLGMDLVYKAVEVMIDFYGFCRVPMMLAGFCSIRQKRDLPWVYQVEMKWF